MDKTCRVLSVWFAVVLGLTISISGAPAHSHSPGQTTPRHPTQPTRPSVADADEGTQTCSDDTTDNVITVGDGHGNIPIPGMKISITLEFPNGAQKQTPCGCQKTTQAPPHTQGTTQPATTAITTTTATAATTTTTQVPTTSHITAEPTTPTQPPPPTTTTTSPPPTATKTAATTTTTPPPPSTRTTTKATSPPPPPDTTTITTTPPPVVTTVAKTTKPPPVGPKCYTCDDHSCQTQKLHTCPSSAPLCMNTVTQDIKGQRTFSKGCASELVCKEEWYVKTSGLADCYLLDDSVAGPPGLRLDNCSFCCRGDGCNKPAVPSDALWFPSK